MAHFLHFFNVFSISPHLFKIVCLISISHAIPKNAVKITTVGKKISFFTLLILYVLGRSISSEYLAVSLFSVRCLSHSNRRKSKDKGGGGEPLHMGKYKLLLNPKTLVHSEELIINLNNTLWKQTLMQKCKTRNENLRGMANHNVNKS